MSLIVLSDVDGTLLERDTYSWAAARPVVEQLRQRRIPLVLCTSKTRAEVEHLRRELGLFAPFIVENGSAVLFDKGGAIELGISYAEIRKRLIRLRAALGLDFAGYGDLHLPDVCRATGLGQDAARRAMQRAYSETLLQAELTPEQWERLSEALAGQGLACVQGSRFYTVTGERADKGRAVRLLLQRLRQDAPDLRSVGVGDSPNDAPMLAEVDEPYLVQTPEGEWAPLDLPGLRRVEGVGPKGFRMAVEDAVTRLA